MPGLLQAARTWVDGIHLNAGVRTEREGRAVWLKKRGFMAPFVFRLANGFFRVAKNPVEALVRAGDWRAWEVECFRALHGPEFTAGCDADGSPWIELLPGHCLSSALTAHALTPAMLAAAAVELRRAHALHSAYYQGGWSHGDPHTGNFLFDPATGRARLIDFEVRHLRTLSAVERHADDVLVLLQDVCGRCRAEDWPALAQAVIEGYACPEVIAILRVRLSVPGGFARLWWAVRTTWMPRVELERRLAILR